MARPWADGWEEPSAREHVPVTLEQMKIIADRAERGRLTIHEVNRLRLGLEQLATRLEELEGEQQT